MRVESTKSDGAFVRAEMAEQPEVLERLLARREELRSELQLFKNKPLRGVILAARGSSDNAANYARYVLEASLGCPASLSANSLFTRYHCRTRLNDWLVVGVSQSGATPEVTEVLESARALGARTLALTNDADSPLAVAADSIIAFGAGVERAVPATKTYTATLMAVALVADIIGTAPWAPGALDRIPEHVATTLQWTEDLQAAVELLAVGAPSLHLGRGFLYCAALESALKMREAARLPVQGFSTSDFLHGPIAASGADTVAVCHVGSGPTREDSLVAADLLAARGAKIVAISSDSEMNSRGGASGSAASIGLVRVPEIEESLAAIVHAIRGQQFAVEVALARGLDPDNPAGLTKVTPTS